MTSWTDYQDDISDAISDSMDADWSASVGAKAVVAWLNEHKPLSAAPAPEGGAAVPSSWSIRYQGIDTREEAPAEAGVKAADLKEAFDLWTATTRAEDQTVWSAFYAGSHLPRRAQPPAREDAQPVAWRVTNKATGHDELFWKPLADLPFNRERFSTEPLYTHPAPDALEQIDPATVETAIGGAYDMPDGRKFWIDAPVAREMTNRVLAALQAEQKGGAA